MQTMNAMKVTIKTSAKCINAMQMKTLLFKLLYVVDCLAPISSYMKQHLCMCLAINARVCVFLPDTSQTLKI